MSGKVIAVLVGLICIAAVGVAAEPSSTVAFGEALAEDLETTPIAQILAAPDDWVGKRVRISGEVSGVCSKQGCWMDITSPDDSTLRVKVDDGVIVFPQDAVGHQAVADGTVEILELEREKYEAWMKHVADEEGRAFDPAEVGEGPYRIVRVRGVAAEIAGL